VIALSASGAIGRNTDKKWRCGSAHSLQCIAHPAGLISASEIHGDSHVTF
jgi:hypothetical protein